MPWLLTTGTYGVGGCGDVLLVHASWSGRYSKTWSIPTFSYRGFGREHQILQLVVLSTLLIWSLIMCFDWLLWHVHQHISM